MNYEIIASDLDGTLLNSKSELSAENAEAIRLLSERGVHFVPATGRSFAEIPTAIKDSPYIRYYIHSGGAAIYDKKTDTRTRFCLSAELSKKIFEVLYKHDCHITVRMNGRIYSDSALVDKASLDYYNVWKVHSDILFASGIFLENLRETLMSAENVEMITLFFHDDSDRYPIIEKVGALGGVNFAEACPYNLEITSDTADKGRALLALAESLGVDTSRVMALGDSGNDSAMIKAAGLGLAVSNSMPELVKIADSLISSNDEHALKYVLEKYF